MKYDCGFIGVGNMGSALASAVCRAISPERIIVTDRSMEKASSLAEERGCSTGDTEELIRESKFIFIGVKPQMMEETLLPYKETLRRRSDRFILVSMAAGLPMERILGYAGGSYPIIRIMPNLPVAVGEGTILYSSKDVTGVEISEFLAMLSPAGGLFPLEENLIDAGCSVSGCGPAFVYMFIEALAKGGTECGLEPGFARILAEKTVLGSAKYASSSEKGLSQLTRDVCSPGGSTIKGVEVLNASAVPESVVSAVRAAYKRNRELGGK